MVQLSSCILVAVVVALPAMANAQEREEIEARNHYDTHDLDAREPIAPILIAGAAKAFTLLNVASTVGS